MQEIKYEYSGVSIKDFSKICRFCLECSASVSLYTYEFNETLLDDILVEVSLPQPENCDKLPPNLCHECVDLTIKFYLFKKKIKESEALLVKILEDAQTKPDEAKENQDNCSLEEETSEDEDKPKRRHGGKSVPEDLTCPFCQNKFDAYEEYLKHRKKEADQRRKKLSCSICHKLISTYKLKDHVNSHTKECPYQCSVCGDKFRFRSSLTRHSFKHREKKPHVCHICGKGFIQAPTLADHLRTHVGERSFICNHCGKTFITKHALGNHLSLHKLKDDTFLTCKTCNSVFSSKASLRNHLNTHNERTKEFLCNECGKEFWTKSLLDSHLKIHLGIKPYICEVCSKGFPTKNSLQKHNLVHTGEKPVSCIVCEKKFSQKGHLVYHMRKHSGERPYNCTYCNKSFNHTGSLKVHIRIHTGEKPFVCDICSKGFYDSSSMKKHKKVHHCQNKIIEVSSQKVKTELDGMTEHNL